MVPAGLLRIQPPLVRMIGVALHGLHRLVKCLVLLEAGDPQSAALHDVVVRQRVLLEGPVRPSSSPWVLPGSFVTPIVPPPENSGFSRTLTRRLTANPEFDCVWSEVSFRR